MRRCGELLFVVFLSLAFILNPALTFGGEKKQESITINEQDLQNYLQTFKGVIEKYMDELEKQGIKVDRERVEKELNNLMQFRGPLELNEKVLNEYLEKNINKINEMIKDNMPKDPAQSGGNLGNLLGGLGGSAAGGGLLGGLGGGGLLGGLGGSGAGGAGAVSTGPTNMGAPGQIDSLMNTLGRVLGGLFEGTILGGPIGSALGVALGFALDAGISIAEIIGLAVLAGSILALMVFVALLIPGVLIGGIIGAIIWTLLTVVVIYLMVGSGTFLVVFFALFLLPFINIFIAALLALITSTIFSLLTVIPSAIVGGVIGGILGIFIAPIGAILAGFGGALIGGVGGAILAAAEQIIFIPIIVLFGLIGLVIGIPALAITDSILGLYVSTGRSVFSTAVKSVESYGSDYLYHIDDIAMDILRTARDILGPKSYNTIKQIEVIIDTADLSSAEGINKTNEQILQMLPALIKVN